MTVEPGRLGEEDKEAEDNLQKLAAGESFPFVCTGCGDCCRKRRDLVLSGLDLYRIARRLSLPPRIVAAAFCKRYTAPQSCLPTLCLTPDPATGDCRFLEGGGCAIHAARPLACALYPLGQSIDTRTGRTEYLLQTPLCGMAEGQSLKQYLDNSGISERSGTDIRWAVVCTEISGMLCRARDQDCRGLAAAIRRCEKALYFDYALGEEFYPQFQQNIETLMPLLTEILRVK